MIRVRRETVVRRVWPPGSRRGALLLEALISLVLGVLVLGAFCGVLLSTLRWSRTLAGRSEALEVVRTTWGVLDQELRPGMVGRDWTPATGPVIALRAFRGVGRVCPGGGGGEWTVAYRGRRSPDPGRDSLLVLGSDGGWRTFPLSAAYTVPPQPGCPPLPGEAMQRWGWPQGASSPSPVITRLFEAGEYHLADGALRYSRGGGGRQPLTPERLGAESGFRALNDGVEVRIEFPGNPGAGDLEPFLWTVRGLDQEGP